MELKLTDDWEQKMRVAWEHFSAGDETYDYSVVRLPVLESWKRSRASGVNPYSCGRSVNHPNVKELLNENRQLLRAARPHLMRVFDIVKISGYYLFICDVNGYILDIVTDDEVKRKCPADEGFTVGHCHAESCVGTNGAYTAMMLDAPIQLRGEEHYILPHKTFTCSGAPIHDPNGRVIGALCFSGSKDTVQPHTLATVAMVANMIELQLKEQSVASSNGAALVYTFKDAIGNCPKMQTAKSLGKRIAGRDSAVLIRGESGTGKEIFAQSIHSSSYRSNGPFVAINCGAIPENLIESELFGYVGGAFTGAQKGGKMGKLEAASGGTLFLDEIESMPMNVQIKLLRAISSGSVARIGAVEETPVDIRLISATKLDLLAEADAGRFREDLYFRISVVRIDLPPLRERGDDIRLLADHYIKYYTEKFRIGPVEVSPGFYRALEQHSWRGNVRELRNVIEGILALLERNTPLTESALPESFFEESQPAAESTPKESRNLARITSEAIEEELRKTNGNVSLAAQRLGISRGTIYSRMKKKEL